MDDLFNPSGIDEQFGDIAASAPLETRTAMDRLLANKELHDSVLEKLRQRLNFSENAMSQMYSRWEYNEHAVQAYVRLPGNEERLANANRAGEPPKVVSIVVPYVYSSIEAMVTYLSSVLFGSDIIFPTMPGPTTNYESAQKMEQVLQYNADHSGLVRSGFQFLWDSAVYGCNALQIPYVEEYSTRTRIFDLFGSSQRQRETVLSYSGNMPQNIDPWNYFPDPRVPIYDVASKGDFCFWRTYESYLDIKDMEDQGIFQGVGLLDTKLPNSDRTGTEGGRNRRVGSAHINSNHSMRGSMYSIENFIQLDQGAVRLIPSKWGLGKSDKVELWLFTLGNKNRILQAEPLNLDHGMRPIVSAEPWTFGYEFGSLSAVDFLIPMQETMSWFINSRIQNVRHVVNNMFVVDPSKVEMSDLTRTGPGKVIRLKKSFYSSDVRSAIQQFQVVDVTQSHINDIQLIQRLADSIFGVSDNLRGVVNTGGRKSATEVRLGGEMGASRLQKTAKLISAQAMMPLAQQMAINIQQFMPNEMSFNILGPSGEPQMQTLTPGQISGDFMFKISDGTLPMDKIGLLDTWQNIWLAVAQDPTLRAIYRLDSIFEFIAELSGAKNIKQFKQQTAPNPVAFQQVPQSEEQISRDLQAGNIVPIQQARFA